MLRPSPDSFQPVSSTLTAGASSTAPTNCSCGSCSAAAARWQIASTVPTARPIPNSSRASSVMSRRETRLRAVSVTTAACSLGPNADRDTSAGSRAAVLARQRGQRSR